MRKLNTLLIAFVAVLMSACAPNHSNLTPTPQELIETPVYQNQITRIDIQRELEGKEKISDIIKKHKLSKINNGSEPIIIEISKDKNEEDGVGHNKQKIQEYYIEDAPKIEVDETDYDEEDRAILDDESYQENPIFEEIDFSYEEDKVNVDDEKNQEDLDFEESDFSFELGEEEQEEEKEPKKQEIVKVQEPSVKKPKITKKEKSGEVKKPEIKEKETESKKTPPQEDATHVENPIVEEPEVIEDEKKIESNKLVAAWDGKDGADSFTKYTLDAIEKYGDTLLEGTLDDKGYCPNYNNQNIEERRAFWLMLVSLVVKKESDFDTAASYKEDNGKYSRGLFQLGYAAYGDCNIRKKSISDRHDPQKNLECGVVIMNYWARKDKVLRGFVRKKGKREWIGVSRYWSVMREEIWSGKKRESLREIKNTLKDLPYCK